MMFWLGAVAYPLMEMAWRGRTHPSMALAGGVSAALLQRMSKTNRPLYQLALAGGLAITGIEYAVGKIFNRRYQVWDYRRMPLNVRGQICLPYTVLWCALSAGAIGLFRITRCRTAEKWPFRP